VGGTIECGPPALPGAAVGVGAGPVMSRSRPTGRGLRAPGEQVVDDAAVVDRPLRLPALPLVMGGELAGAVVRRSYVLRCWEA
jgi:hypothetical protein